MKYDLCPNELGPDAVEKVEGKKICKRCTTETEACRLLCVALQNCRQPQSIDWVRSTQKFLKENVR